MARSPAQLGAELRGLFAFPVTPFGENGEVDLRRYREHLQYLIGKKPDALFVCAGTGEFYSLDLNEYRSLVRAAAEEGLGKLPVVAGIGYGTRLAQEFAKVAEEEGADGLMVMPPYLVQSEQEGLFLHYRNIATSTHLGIIVYQRDNAIFAPPTVSRLAELPNVVGFKDGHGEMERLIRIRLIVGDRLALMNGMPTAELSALAFKGIGVSSYSSAVFNFVPEISRAFYLSLTQGDESQLHRLIEGFYQPFANLRDCRKGYAVSLIKAGVNALARSVGEVRPPLVYPSPEHAAELKVIVERGLALVEPGPGFA
jgi:5-dehydro-4-deoxyglucarate dehydratase